MSSDRDRARAVIERHGRTYASDAGITLRDAPAPLYQLLVLAMTLSARISGEVAVAAARELFRAGYRTPRKMADAGWQERVDALGRGHYRRYDERTATMLGDGANLVIDRWRGDLRRLHREAGGDVSALRSGLKAVPGIGDVGVDIFLREAQAVWPDLRPFADARALRGAEAAGLPPDAGRLARLVPDEDFVRLVAGLVRLSLDRRAARELSG